MQNSFKLTSTLFLQLQSTILRFLLQYNDNYYSFGICYVFKYIGTEHTLSNRVQLYMYVVYKEYTIYKLVLFFFWDHLPKLFSIS